MVRQTLGLMTAVLVLAVPAAAQDMRHMAPERSVTTSGQASVRLAPDRAWVTVGIEARAQKPQEAQKQAAEVMRRIQMQLEAIGIPADAIRTVSFNLHADWDYSNNRRTLRGYVVSNLVEVKVDDLTKVAEVLDRSIASGGNTIHGVRWDLQHRDKVERDALRQAVEDAKQRAEVAVAAAGATLGPVLRINEQRQGQPRPMDMLQRQEMAATAAAPPQTPISPGEIEIRSTVTVVFSIAG
jgi:uncharacterized protein